MVVDLRDRTYVSQYAQDTLGLVVHRDGVPADVDGDVTVTMTHEVTSNQVLSRVANHTAVGTYEIKLTADESSVIGPYEVRWDYTVDGVAEHYLTFIMVGESAPDYDRLLPEMKDIVDSVWIRFADLFDSTLGGPHLQTYFQTNFGRGRLAQLLRIALGVMNTSAQPFQTFTLDGNGGPMFPVAQWGPLLSTALYIETIKHLIRSYVEQPVAIVNQISRLDRRDYMDRWRSVLQDEMAMFKSQLEVFKISMMGLGSPRVLVSGGVFGRYAPTRMAGSVAARPRYWSRFY